MYHHKRREIMKKTKKKIFKFEYLAEAFRKEIEEYGENIFDMEFTSDSETKEFSF